MNPPVRTPICPTLLHDDPTRILVCVVLLALCSYCLYRVMRHFGR